MNEFDATIVRYRNRQDCGRAIVLYDDDERLAARAGLLFCDKGVDNVFVLTGGLREFGARCPDLIDGDGFHRNEEDEELGGAAVRPPAPPGGFVDPRAPPAVSRARAAALARAARERPPGGAAAAAPPPPQPWQQPPRGRLAAEPSWIPTARWR